MHDGTQCHRIPRGPFRMKTVLLIDDDTELREALGAYLRQRGWEVHSAADGDSGLNLAKQLLPQVILCDMYMPCGNGFRVCAAIREQPSLKPAFLVAMSGNMFDDTRRNALEAGADEFMLKPLQPRPLLELLEKVSAAHDGRPAERVPRVAAAPAAPTAASAPAPPPGPGNFIRFWGVRGSIPTPGPATVRYGGNTACVELRADGELIILDAGTGIRPLGMELMNEFKNQPLAITLLITHSHWDHVQGFPFFPPAYNEKNQIGIHGFEGAWASLEGVFSGQMESPYFPIGLQQMPGNIHFKELRELEFKIGKVRAEASFINHPGVTVGFRFNTSTGSVAYLPDHESSFRMRSLSTAKGPVTPEELAFARREDEKTLRFIHGVDLLILDAQYDVEEYRSRVGWGHSCVDDTVELATRAKAKRLFLFHHDPTHDDDKIDAMAAHARELAAWHGHNLEVEAAREGLLVPLGTPAAARKSG
jgi:phosphoribosyl 1,2-cyclic phosphodiesterase/CheY-like chemotaxis protein